MASHVQSEAVCARGDMGLVNESAIAQGSDRRNDDDKPDKAAEDAAWNDGGGKKDKNVSVGLC